jgi:hypothetical protein
MRAERFFRTHSAGGDSLCQMKNAATSYALQRPEIAPTWTRTKNLLIKRRFRNLRLKDFFCRQSPRKRKTRHFICSA